MTLDFDVLDIDLEAEAERIATRLREATAHVLRRRGLVVAISGGIDSSCCAALAVRAVGPDRVFGLVLPERDSSDDSAVRAGILARHLGIRVETVDIAPALEAIGCYRERDAAVLVCVRHKPCDERIYVKLRVIIPRAQRDRAAAQRIRRAKIQSVGNPARLSAEAPAKHLVFFADQLAAL